MVPADFRSTDFDKSPWIAIKTRPTLSQLRREYKTAIPADYKGAGSKDSPEPLREHDQSRQTGGISTVRPPVQHDPDVLLRTHAQC